MRDRSVKIEPFDFLDLLTCDMLKPLNDHARVRVKGHIAKSNVDKYLEMVLEEEDTAAAVICVDESGVETTVFRGIVQGLKIYHQNDVNVLEADLISYSYLLDLNPRVRVFQNENSAYAELLAYLGQAGEDDAPPYADYSFMMHVPEAQRIGDLVVQYLETDWQFAKRMASRFNSYLVPDYLVGGVKYYFGRPILQTGSINNQTDYVFSKAVDQFMQDTSKGLDVNEADYLSYLVKHRDVFELTQPIVFQDRTLLVAQIESHLVGKELLHTYLLRWENSIKTVPYDNPQISGVSMAGTVVDVRNDEVQILIQEDGIQEPAKWFPFSTVYSSPDGTGWYCMPEKEEAIRLYFPTEKEAEGYVVNATHIADSGNLHRANPDYKSFKNKYGKEVLFTPDAMVLTNNDGISIEVVDGKGISMKSNQNITLVAGEEIAIASAIGNLDVLAKEVVLVKQAGTEIKLQGTVQVSGQQVVAQGGVTPLPGCSVKPAVGLETVSILDEPVPLADSIVIAVVPDAGGGRDVDPISIGTFEPSGAKTNEHYGVYSYTTPDGWEGTYDKNDDTICESVDYGMEQTYNDIHIFRTVYPEWVSAAVPKLDKSVSSLDMFNLPVTKEFRHKTIIGRINSNDYGGGHFNGLVYTGGIRGALYQDGKKLVIQDGQYILDMYNQHQFQPYGNGKWYNVRPALVIYRDESVKLRWFETAADLYATCDIADSIISGFNPVIYDGKNIFRESVTSTEGYLVCDPNLRTKGKKIVSEEMHFSLAYGYGRWASQTTSRTLLGYRERDKSFFLIACSGSTKSNAIRRRLGLDPKDITGLALPVCADLLADLGCTWGINLDGGNGTAMHVSVDGVNKTVYDVTNTYYTAVCAYKDVER